MWRRERGTDMNKRASERESARESERKGQNIPKVCSFNRKNSSRISILIERFFLKISGDISILIEIYAE
jgi:hypothetical protein